MKMKCQYFAILAAFQVSSCLTLQLLSPGSGNVRLYEIPDIQHGPGKATLNTVVIKSKPVSSRSTGNEKISSKWRRTLEIENVDNNKGENSSDLTEQPSLCFEENCSEVTPAPTFKPYSQEELQMFLQNYAEQHGKPVSEENDAAEEASNKLANLYMENEAINILETTLKPTDKDKSKSASWQLVQSQAHNHPYDDHKGWVTLEPIPWSASQIQKWEPNPNSRPQIPTWDYKPDYNNNYNYKPQHFSTERPWNKPTYEYKPQRPSYNQNWQNQKPHWNQNEDHQPSHWNSNPEIITDTRPGSAFPSDLGYRPSWNNHEEYNPTNQPYQGYHNKQDHPSGHPSGPSDGNGRWVLLSSTKGYSVPPHRHGYQRSLTLDTSVPNSMSSHRTVRLTVLPALANTTNTTTSHGGLLEVESTFQTVEEAQREHAARMMKSEETKQKNDTMSESVERNNKISGVQLLTKNSVSKKAAIIAAVGAGMIPATMAMLMPMVLGRRKRSLEGEVELKQKQNITKKVIYKKSL